MAPTAARARKTHPVGHALRRVLAAATGSDPKLRLRVCHLAAHSNQVTKVGLPDGRIIVVKRGRHPWARERFAAGRAAASLLRRRTGILAPEHLAVPLEIAGRALDAYWWIPLPTLKEVWPFLAPALRPRVLRSWGALARRIHAVRVHGCGRLADAERHPTSLRDYLESDISGRLLPAVIAVWPAASGAVAELLSYTPEIVSRASDLEGSLLHNDLHMGNVLCGWSGGGPTCVGVIDLEDALAGPPEMDLARLEVLHGPLLGQRLPRAELEEFRAGYGRPLDTALLAFFRAYHLANIGFHAALVGYGEQARVLVDEVRNEIASTHQHLTQVEP